jgi:PKHD-type hydroxylase
LAATLFLSDPSSYDGGDLVVRDAHNEQYVKLPAGHLLLYSAGSRQEIRPVVRGVSFRCVFWIQSMIRDSGQRKILFDMDSAIQTLAAKAPDDPSITRLAGVYHNLLRYWAQV